MEKLKTCLKVFGCLKAKCLVGGRYLGGVLQQQDPYIQVFGWFIGGVLQQQDPYIQVFGWFLRWCSSAGSISLAGKQGPDPNSRL